MQLAEGVRDSVHTSPGWPTMGSRAIRHKQAIVIPMEGRQGSPCIPSDTRAAELPGL